MSNKEREELKSRVETMLFQSLIQICGNGLYLEGNEDERTNSHDRHNNDYSAWTAELTNVAHTTISFPNKNSTYLDGKPHDIEIRAPLALFHRCVGKKRKRLIHHSVTTVSNFGVARTIHSPVQLASLLCCTLEETLRYENLTNIIRPNASGIICLVTIERAQLLRESGRFPCPQCVKWCKGEKGLWWHQQMDHGQEHAVAAATAASEKNVLALVVYNPNQALSFRNTPCHEQRSRECQDEASIVFEHARNGNLERIKEAIENGFDPHKTLDRNGASLLLWAAGSGHLHIVNYLTEQCECSPNQEQEGKRSFSGRTPLHWSARNGHLNVVQYLVDKCYVDIDATTADGTTAFCWASWQGHLQVMKFLHQNGANVKKENSFGCTAVLWCAQGEGNIEMMEWMQSIGLSLVTTNSNGHGALHKSAQRKRRDLCEWLCNSVYDSLTDANIDIFDNLGPDTEGCCPSDLAGMAGDDELALFIAKQETRLIRRWSTKMLLAQSNHMTLEGNRQDHLLHCSLPKWLQQEDSVVKHIANEKELNVWESLGGVHRMQKAMPFSLTF